ncbi:MAG: FtsW/RodA/SpoVE family cell cycle protein, partial [Candidatus Cloacimonetes bacterium]|nr:FtsW/RodA/SpoVE family cell cycle protein [Candidatus Cloacimonadota bacterium]
FAIIGEEFGFLGALSVLGMYVFLFIRSIISSYRKEDLYLKLAGIGLGMNIFFNAMVNIGVAMAAIPSTGVTLPFISYGGTSLLVNSFTIGLLLNISATRQKF